MVSLTRPHFPHVPPCGCPTEVMQRGSLKPLAAALGVLESPVFMAAWMVRASSACAASAPFQKLACSRTGHKREHWHQFPLHLVSLVIGFASFAGTPPSPCISSQGRRACLLLQQSHRACFLAPGVQGEGEVLANSDREVEGLTLAGQRLAEFQALREQGSVIFGHCSHFDSTSELRKCSG